MARWNKKSADGFNLAFLDVMACGLGAVILIFMLVDFQESTIDTTAEKQRLEAELAANQDHLTQLQKSIDAVNDNIAMETEQQAALQRRQQDIEVELDNTQQAIATEQAILADLDNQLAAVEDKVAKAAAVTKVGTGEQNYIVGMPVTGKHIGIMLDSSSSMMATELVDILLASTLPDHEKVAQPKWRRTINIATWLLARIPPDASVTLVAFSDKAAVLGPRNKIAASSFSLLGQLRSDLSQVIPSGGTNLKLGFATLMQANPQVDSVYLITDGLPTLGDGLLSRRCLQLTARKTISAKCRQELGEKTLAKFMTAHRGVVINTILLPIEGDPFASSTYWRATWASGGKMLSPALEWN